MLDSQWWNTFLALPGASHWARGPTRRTAVTDSRGTRAAVASEVDGASRAGFDIDEELALEVYWVDHYFTMTGYAGRWIYRGDNFPTRARAAFGRWVCRFLYQVWYVLEQVPWFLQNALPVVGKAFILCLALSPFAFVFYWLVRFVLWMAPLRI